jgi:cytoskeleton protein RodZ
MASVGAFLRELRARRGVSLEEIARTTRVAPRYLEALEADAYDDLPAPVFIRGFIRAYCQALGESPNDALTCYDSRDGRVPQPAARPAPIPRAGGTDARTRGAIVVSFVLLVVLGMALFTVALVIRPRDRASIDDVRSSPPATPVRDPGQGSSPLAASSPAAPRVTVPPPSSAPTATPPPPVAARPPGPPTTPPATTPPAPAGAARPPAPAVSVTPTPAASAAMPPADPSTPPGARASATVPGLQGLAGSVSAPYRLIARISDATWIRVRTEDGRISEETLPAGEVREWVSDRPFVVTIGNAGGVALELNGRALPPLGATGVVIPRLVLPPEPR